MKTLENLAIVQRHNDNNLCQHVTKVNRVCFVDRKRAKTSVSCPKVVSMYVCMTETWVEWIGLMKMNIDKEYRSMSRK